MKAVAALALLVAMLPLAAHALEEDGYESIGALRADFRKADAVVVIRPVEVSADPGVKTIGNVYRTRAEVLERLKGTSKAGAAIDFCTVFEDKPNEFYSQSSRIAFLRRVRDGKARRPMLVEIENSSREASSGNLEKVRAIRGKEKRRR